MLLASLAGSIHEMQKHHQFSTAKIPLSSRNAFAWVVPLLSLLLLLLFVVPTATAATPSSDSSGPTPISGGESITITASTSPIPYGVDLALYQLSGSTYTGSISGTSVSAGVITVHTDNTFIARIVETFTGTILDSASGTATIRTVCAGTQAAFTCTFRIDGGEGGLAGVQAKGTVTAAFTGQNTISTTYTGLARFGQQQQHNDDASPATTTLLSTFSSSPNAQNGDRSSRAASGTASVTVTASASTKDANGNTITYLLLTDMLTGTISGTAIGAAVLVTSPDGTTNARAVTTFTGSVLKLSGTAAFFISASGTPISITGHYELTHGRGGLAGIEVEGPFSATATSSTTFTGPYSGHVLHREGNR